MFLNALPFFGKGEGMSSIDRLKDADGHISKENIVKVIPYNDHFLFVDEVVSLEKGKIIAKKRITGREDFLKGHFVGFPITPGALIVEGLGQNIVKVIPYNDHFLFVDEVVSLEKGKIIAKKRITGREDFLKGHFVGFPITPGALIVEGLGQAATFLARYNIPDHEKKDVLAYKIRDAKFMAPVLPGDEMTYEVVSQGQMEKLAMMQGKVLVGGNLVAEAFMMLAIVDREAFRGKHPSKP